MARRRRAPGKPVRAGIFVERQSKTNQAPLGATSSEYAAPTGLKFYLGSWFYKYAAPDGAGNRRSVAVPGRSNGQTAMRFGQTDDGRFFRGARLCPAAGPVAAMLHGRMRSEDLARLGRWRLLRLVSATHPRSGGRPQGPPAAGGNLPLPKSVWDGRLGQRAFESCRD